MFLPDAAAPIITRTTPRTSFLEAITPSAPSKQTSSFCEQRPYNCKGNCNDGHPSNNRC